MKTYVVLPVPMETPDVWKIFNPWIIKFAESFRRHPPGGEYKIAAVINAALDAYQDKRECEVAELLDGLPFVFSHYDGPGMDIGSAQHFAFTLPENSFLVCCTSRMYSWKDGWLHKLVEARQSHGDGLYATMVSFEHRLHACTRGYGLDSNRWNAYARKINTKQDGIFFESGCLGDGKESRHWNMLEWFHRQKLPARVVYWDRCLDIGDGKDAADVPNSFRRGDQSNLLMKDWITDMYCG